MDILHQEPGFVVCVKPVGLDSEHGVPDALKTQLGGEFFPIHRLDTNVAGVMVYARTKQAASILSRAVAEGTMVKEYQALVHGAPPETGDWTDLLWKDSRKNKVYVVDRPRGGVKEARLTYTRLTGGETSLVHVRLYTGRTHQIRVQFASRGFPLVGDHKYGARDGEKAPFLHCCRITFPWKGQNRSFSHFPAWGNPAIPGF